MSRWIRISLLTVLCWTMFQGSSSKSILNNLLDQIDLEGITKDELIKKKTYDDAKESEFSYQETNYVIEKPKPTSYDRVEHPKKHHSETKKKTSNSGENHMVENCREYVNSKVSTPEDCAFFQAQRNFEEGPIIAQCRWDANLAKVNLAGACLCPRTQIQCYSMTGKCHWQKNVGSYDNNDDHDREPTGICISNAERFYNVLHKLLLKRGKKDFAIRINYNSIPAKGELPYGPYGPSIIDFATNSRLQNHPSHFKRYYQRYDGGIPGYGLDGLGRLPPFPEWRPNPFPFESPDGQAPFQFPDGGYADGGPALTQAPFQIPNLGYAEGSGFTRSPFQPLNLGSPDGQVSSQAPFPMPNLGFPNGGQIAAQPPFPPPDREYVDGQATSQTPFQRPNLVYTDGQASSQAPFLVPNPGYPDGQGLPSQASASESVSNNPFLFDSSLPSLGNNPNSQRPPPADSIPQSFQDVQAPLRQTPYLMYDTLPQNFQPPPQPQNFGQTRIPGQFGSEQLRRQQTRFSFPTNYLGSN